LMCVKLILWYTKIAFAQWDSFSSRIEAAATTLIAQRACSLTRR